MPKLATKNACTGCGACDNICPKKAIEIKPETDSFLYPQIDLEKCVECKLCEKACPIVNGKTDVLKNNETIDTFALWSYPDRTSSSSGGAFSAIARQIFSDGGIVYGAAWINGFECEHISIDTVDDLSRLRGSKYLQSKINSTFKEIRSTLDSGRKVLFTGTPCQVAGLKSFLGKDYTNLLCIDIVCHGVPSNDIFKAYINKLKKEYPKYKDETGFEFRNLRAWGYAPSTKTKYSNKILVGAKNAYMYAFEKALIFRESCYDCQFNGLKRVGDITIADFWGIGQFGIPFKHDVSKGVSLILVNNTRGEFMISHLDNIFIERRDINEAIKLNHNIIRSSKYCDNRDIVINSFLSEDKTLTKICKDFSLLDKSIKGRIERLLTRFNLYFPLKSIYNKLHI